MSLLLLLLVLSQSTDRLALLLEERVGSCLGRVVGSFGADSLKVVVSEAKGVKPVFGAASEVTGLLSKVPLPSAAAAAP